MKRILSSLSHHCIVAVGPESPAIFQLIYTGRHCRLIVGVGVADVLQFAEFAAANRLLLRQLFVVVTRKLLRNCQVEIGDSVAIDSSEMQTRKANEHNNQSKTHMRETLTPFVM
jgi:hypothetical protein